MASSESPDRLNVGAGAHPLEGYLNTDIHDFDAGKRPWPYEDGRFQEVRAHCVLPHIPPPPSGQEDGLFVFLSEAFRVLAPGGRLVVTAPQPDPAWRALAGIHHYRVIAPSTFSGFLGKKTKNAGQPGVYASGGPFRSLTVKRGQYGPHAWNQRDAKGRPLGESRFLARFWAVGVHRLGILTHVWRRLRLRFLLRGDKVVYALEK